MRQIKYKQFQGFALYAGILMNNQTDLYDVFVDQVLPQFDIEETMQEYTLSEFKEYLINTGIDYKLMPIISNYYQASLLMY